MSSRIDPASAQAEYPTPEIVACPYPFYAKLREESPVHRLENGDFLVTRWEDLVTVARRPEVFSNSIELINPGFAEAMGARAGEGRLSSWATPFTDPPDHTVKRSLLLGMFMPDQLRVYEPTIRVLADELIDALPDGRTDFRTAFADELPPGTMLRLFGVPREDETIIREWMQSSTGQGFHYASAQAKARHRAAMISARDYFEAALLERVAHPTGDFLSELARRKQERDGELDLYYLVGEITTIYSAAYHNTVYMLMNAMRLLLEHPGEMARLRAEPTRIRLMIDEALRLESPVQWLQRYVLKDTVLAGVEIPRGSVVLTVWAAGNRDPERFEDPAAFRIDRQNVVRDHLAFGYGIHKCVGARLARLEGQIAFERLLARSSDIRLAVPSEELTHAYDVNHRQLASLPIEFDLK